MLCSLTSSTPPLKINVLHTPFTVGSSAESSLQLSSQLEPVHFAIIQEGNQFFLASNAQVIVDGVIIDRFTPRIIIQNGTQINFGEFEFVFTSTGTGKMKDARETVHLRYQMVCKSLE
ncbi:Conserved_hypothetical protein [Hexamita inflata]|uniref:FHA domain-containing protein n=1 Tax=Hexamita inflata TaxID=28002 RepID=A0AA86NF60_9EUKA|nr:Conserved hypothetical protein [Hexamita inflata]